MSYPVAWHNPPWYAQQHQQQTEVNTSSSPRNTLKRAHTITGPISFPEAGWASSAVTPYAQDFVLPGQQVTFPVASVNSHTWSEMNHSNHNPFSVSEMQNEVSSNNFDLSKLPFFRSQLLKQQSRDRSYQESNGISKDELDERKTRRSSVQQQATGHTDPTGPRDRLAGNNRRLDELRRMDFHRSRQFAKVYVHGRSSSGATDAFCWYLPPKHFVSRVPRIEAPKDPKSVQVALKLLKPMVVYAKFDCGSGCRSRGICVHFSFVLGCRRTPDGLLCPICRQAGIEKSYAAHRLCGRHNKSTLSQFVVNLPEDILASAKQEAAAKEILRRSWECNWDGAPVKAQYDQDTTTKGNNADKNARTGERDSSLPSIEEESLPDDSPLKRQKRSGVFEPNNGNCDFNPAAEHDDENLIHTAKLV